MGTPLAVFDSPTPRVSVRCVSRSRSFRGRSSSIQARCYLASLSVTRRYEDLLEQWFFRLHDPTTLNRQGNDIGTQYRSAIFPQSPEQEATARRVIARVDEAGKWRRPITTSIEPAATWYSAETYHQDYLRKNPGGYTCHFLRE